MAQASLVLAEARKDAQERHLEISRARLLRIVTKKLRTTMVGAMSAVEKRLGVLWGQGKPAEELSESELAWREVWYLLREEILDLGNGQLRAIEKEMPQYQVDWKRYRSEFRLVEDEERNGTESNQVHGEGGGEEPGAGG
jgi:hypothetical protein